METSKYQHEIQTTLEEELKFSYPLDDYERWHSILAVKINALILDHFDKLIFLLYKLDVNEEKLKKILIDHPGSDAGKLIGELIVERQLQKFKTREAFREENTDISENEKW